MTEDERGFDILVVVAARGFFFRVVVFGWRGIFYVSPVHTAPRPKFKLGPSS